VERVHVEMIRAASPERRLRLALSLSRTIMGLVRERIERELPDASSEERDLRFVAVVYGEALAEDLRAYLAERRA
jgi:hypothetical protein